MYRAWLLAALLACGTDRVDHDVIDPPSIDASIGDAAALEPDAMEPLPATLCEEATLHSDFAWIEAKVLVPSCTATCHNAENPYASLRLDAGLARGNLVNVRATSQSGWTRVVPGAPNTSYLLVALGQISGPLPELGYMPLNAPRLCVEIRDAIERWIAAGAP